jgi:hypothetical protein
MKSRKTRKRTLPAPSDSDLAAIIGGFTDPGFIKALEQKAESCFFDASQFKSASGSRRSKWIMRDRVFRAIANLRCRGRLEEFIRQADARPKHDYSNADQDTQLRSKLLEETISCIRSDLVIPPDPEDERVVAQAFVDAVKQGDRNRLNELIVWCQLYETKMIQRPRERQSDVKSWHYYVGMAALHFLTRGEVPSKKEVKERTLVECARAEFPMNVPIADWGNQIDNKINQMQGLLPSDRNWSRIFNDLGLSKLPAASTH